MFLYAISTDTKGTSYINWVRSVLLLSYVMNIYMYFLFIIFYIYGQDISNNVYSFKICTNKPARLFKT